MRCPRSADDRAIYQSKLTTPQEAVKRFLTKGNVCASDIALAHAPAPRGCEADGSGRPSAKYPHHTLLDTGKFYFFQTELAREYRGVTWFSQASARKAVNAGLADVMPTYYRDCPSLFREYVRPEVDFFGQVCAEFIGTSYVSGTGS